MKFIETSAKTSSNVEEAFHLMTKEIIAQMVNKDPLTQPKPKPIVIDDKNRERLDKKNK